MLQIENLFGGRVSGGCSGGGQCRGPSVDRTMNATMPDPCAKECERNCQDEPCVPYACPVKLYDRCVVYTGSAMCQYGVQEGTDVGEVIDALVTMINSYERRIELYHTEVSELRRLVNEIGNAIQEGGGSSGDSEAEETW